MPLTIKDFLKEGEIELKRFSHYFNKNGNLYNVCLEPCLNGFDVAIYVRQGDGAWEICEPKKCTDFKFKRKMIPGKLEFGIDGLKKGEANMVLLRAMKFANEFYKKFNN